MPSCTTLLLAIAQWLLFVWLGHAGIGTAILIGAVVLTYWYWFFEGREWITKLKTKL